MVDLATTHALLIGIEQYDDGVNPLDGAANDVYRFVRWLCDRQVPRDQISVLLSPLEANQKIAQATAELLGQPSLPAATRANVDGAFEQLKKTEASLFWMLWGGHGWVTPAGERRLFYADATRQSYKNLDLSQQLTAMRSTLYKGMAEQVIMVDACANSFKPREGEFPHDQPAIGEPLPNLRQLVMFAASSGEYAENKGIEKAGLFSDEVLKELNLLPVEAGFPDMEAVMSRVQRKFVNLRAEGKVEQTPFLLMYRPFSGGEQHFGQIQPASQMTQPIKPLKMPQPKLDIQAKIDLIDLLMDCRSMTEPELRQAILSQLRPQIYNNLRRSGITRVEVGNLLDICLEYTGGLRELLLAIRGFEDNPETLNALLNRAKQLLPEEAP